jgi:hypothetical protein
LSPIISDGGNYAGSRYIFSKYILFPLSPHQQSTFPRYIISKDNFGVSDTKIPYGELESVDLDKVCCCCHSVRVQGSGI